jgi:nondiscriminating glutamyl-tRNA synthetase
MTVRVRYAPSPTGHLHIGGVRTALFNYLFARHHKGQFLLRVEDTDLERNVPGAEEEMLRGFRWLGFDWDEGPDVGGPSGPYRCTERLDIYQRHLNQLKDSAQVYPCFCTPEELEAEREVAHQEGRMPRYSGKCRHLTAQEREQQLSAGLTPNWRFAIESGTELAVDDLVRGHVTFQSDDIGDFVVVKSNGIPTYNFQVVIDDALMAITHVIRGEEHLSNTPRQLMIYKAFDYAEPKFAHLPQVLNTNRKKLSKRDPNVMPIHAYREKGFHPAAIVNFLALLGWSPVGEEEILTMEELQARFDLERVNRSGAIFDTDKLHWMAGHYIRQTDLQVLTQWVEEQLTRHGMKAPEGTDNAWLQQVVSLYQEQMVCAEDFVTLAKGFFHPETVYTEEALGVMREESAKAVIALYRDLALIDEDWTAETSRARFKQVQKDLGVKGRGLFMPVRAAVTGEVHGPDLQLTIQSLPKAWVIARFDAALAQI